MRRELVLREAEEEVGLVLRLVGGAGEDPAAAGFVVVVAGVVAGGDAVGADLAGGDEELVELEVVVAEGAGDGRASGEVLGDEGPDDLGFEAVLLVDEVVGDVELLGYSAGVVDVVDGAAAALDGLGHALVAGEAALVPELEGEADESVALGTEERGDGGGVDSAGHGYGDGLGGGVFWCCGCCGLCRCHVYPLPPVCVQSIQSRMFKSGLRLRPGLNNRVRLVPDFASNSCSYYIAGVKNCWGW